MDDVVARGDDEIDEDRRLVALRISAGCEGGE
jgi:hypothetical protein